METVTVGGRVGAQYCDEPVCLSVCLSASTDVNLTDVIYSSPCCYFYCFNCFNCFDTVLPIAGLARVRSALSTLLLD